jgi:hypothetical protein
MLPMIFRRGNTARKPNRISESLTKLLAAKSLSWLVINGIVQLAFMPEQLRKFFGKIYSEPDTGSRERLWQAGAADPMKRLLGGSRVGPR